MWFMYAVSWIGFLVQLIVITLSIAAGLFYLAELVEEYATTSGKIIRYLNYFTLFILIGHLLFEELPLMLVACCLTSHILYHLVLRSFPYIELSSPWFILSVILLVINHLLAFSHFSKVPYPFPEILGFFTINLWLIPLALFVSLSACDNVLPTSIVPENRSDNDSDIVTSYFKRKGKKYGLLHFLKSAQDSILPQRVKKSF